VMIVCAGFYPGLTLILGSPHAARNSTCKYDIVVCYINCSSPCSPANVVRSNLFPVTCFFSKYLIVCR